MWQMLLSMEIKDSFILVTNIAREAESEFKYLIEWLNVNKLCVNVKKSNFTVIPSNQRKLKDAIKLMFCDVDMSEVSSCKYLGVFIDNNLDWHKHIISICDKINPRKKLDTSVFAKKLVLWFDSSSYYLLYCSMGLSK